MKKKAKKSLVESVDEEEHYKVPEYKTMITIYSQDQLNMTLSKCGLLMLSNLGTVRHTLLWTTVQNEETCMLAAVTFYLGKC